jgi:electron transfer flavoprotein alpha subunit
MKVLVIAEHSNDAILHSTLHAVTAAQALGEVTLLVAGFQQEKAVEAASKIAGVSHVISVNAEYYQHQLPEELAPLIASLKGQYGAFTATASVFGKNLMPRVAALMDVSQISDITKVVSTNTFEHPIYAGNVIETISTTEETLVLTFRSTAFEASAVGGGNANVVNMDAIEAANLTQFVSSNLTKSDRPELGQAKVIVSGGRALQSKEQFETLLTPLADKLNAAIGASRAAVDSGFVANDYQVGQTGKIVAPELYLALGISGAIQHIAGMQGSKVIVAINKDPDAAIFKIADYGLVGDLFEIIPQLTEQL